MTGLLLPNKKVSKISKVNKYYENNQIIYKSTIYNFVLNLKPGKLFFFLMEKRKPLFTEEICSLMVATIMLNANKDV